MRRVYWFLDVSRGDLQGGIPPNANRSVQPGVPIASQPCVGDGDGVKTDEIRRFENHRPLKLNGSSIRPQRVGCPREFLASLVGPGRIRPHLEEGRNAGLIRKEDGCEDPAKPRISNRQLSMDFGTLLRIREMPSFRTSKNQGFQTGNCREFQNRVDSPVTGYFLTAFGALIGRP